MWCMKCQNDLSECTCPDIEERMASLKGSSHLVMRWCSVCDKHYALCKCENPVWTTNDKMKREN
jgi:hypothetical protein